jgi:hypothetical protein
MLKRKTSFTEKYLYAFPHTDCVAAKGKNMADPYQPTSWRLWKSFVIEGMAVVMIVWKELET